MPEIIAPKQQMANLRSLLSSDKVRQQIASALPRHLDATRMFRIYLTAVQTTPRILECEQTSIIGAVIQASQLGLSLDSVFGEGFIVPRWNKNAGSQVASFQIGYKGLRKLAFQADQKIRDIYARVVFDNEYFEVSYEPQSLRHSPAADFTLRGGIRFAYAKVIWENGYERFVVVGKPEIEKARASSDAYKKGYGPWVEHEEAMWAKTALRRLCDTLTLSADSALAHGLVAEEREERDAAGGIDLDLSLPAQQQTGPTLPERAGSPLDNLVNDLRGAPAPAPAHAQQPRRRRAPQQPVTPPPAPPQAEPPPPAAVTLPEVDPRQAGLFDELPVGSIDPRTGEVVE